MAGDQAGEMPLAFSYHRLSSDKQKKGDGERRQGDETELYCDKMGLKLDYRLKDIGLSGWTGANVHKGALGRFLELVREGEIPKGSHLVVESLDRLSRDKVMRAFRIFSEILEAGITLHTFGDNKIYTEKSVNENFGELIVSLSIMIRANDESSTKAKRQRSTWGEKRKAATETKLTARCPTWLKLQPDRKSFEVLDDRRDIVVRIFTEAADGFGCDSIARRLNREGIKPFSHGRMWHGGTVRAYLQSKAVLGYYQPNKLVRYTVEDGNEKGASKTRREPVGDVITDYYPPIISDDLWHRTWDSIDKRRVGKPANAAGRKGTKIVNLFGGFGRCVRCLSPMNVRNRGERTRHKHKPFLICSNARNGVCPNNRQFTLQPLEDAVLEFVQEIDLHEVRPTESRLLEQQIATKRTKADAIQQKIDNLMEAVEAGSKSAQKRMVELEGQLETIEQEIAGIRHQLDALKGSVPLADRQAAMKELRRRMIVADAKELYEIRTKLRQTLREIITFMSFLRDGHVVLAVKGLDVGYLIKDGKVIKREEQPLGSTA
jgi:DNA invertase Pin-like site-specific DNA recombinase